MIRRLTIALATITGLALSACTSPTSPSQDCGGTVIGSTRCAAPVTR